MSRNENLPAPNHISPFERIRRTNEAGTEYWSSRDFAAILEYAQYRNFEAVISKAKLACFNSGHRIEDHFADVSKMVEIGSGAMPEELPVTESIKKIETKQRRQLGKADKPAKKKSE